MANSEMAENGSGKGQGMQGTGTAGAAKLWCGSTAGLLGSEMVL